MNLSCGSSSDPRCDLGKYFTCELLSPLCKVGIMAVAESQCWVIHRLLRTVPQHSACIRAKSTQSCPTLCDLFNYSSSVHGILQARILEWVCHFLLQVIFPAQGMNLCLLRLLHWQAGCLHQCHLGSLPQLGSHKKLAIVIIVSNQKAVTRVRNDEHLN